MTYRIRLAAAAAAVTVLLLPGAGQAFEEEAEVIEDAMNHTVLQGVQRRIVHQTRLAVTRGGAFDLQTASHEESGGLAAGERAEIGEISAWVNADVTTYSDRGGGILTDGNTYNGLVGGDVVLSGRYLAGLTAGVTGADSESTYSIFDTPGISATGIETETFTFAPYGALILDETIFFGAHAGIAHIQADTFSRGGGFFSSGEHASFAVFAGADANYVTLIDGWEILGSLGLTFSHVTADEYANAANPATDLGIFGGKSSANTRLSLGGQASYPVNIVAGQHGVGAMPYVRAAVEYDIEEVPRGGTAPLTNTPSEEDDPFGLRLAFGADVDIADAAIMSLEFGGVLTRDDYTELSLNANVRLPF